MTYRPEEPESQLVNTVMPNASPEEKAEASRRWFAYLDILGKIAKRQMEEEERTGVCSDCGYPLSEHEPWPEASAPKPTPAKKPEQPNTTAEQGQLF